MVLTTRDFYLLRADECARDAAAAPLANVRERFLRAEAVWRRLAQRALHADRSWTART